MFCDLLFLHTAHSTLIERQYRRVTNATWWGETSHIVYTKHLPARGRSFTHQSLVREDVLSVRQIQYRSPIGEYVGSFGSADTVSFSYRWVCHWHISEHPSASGHPVAASTSVLVSLIQAPSVCLTHTPADSTLYTRDTSRSLLPGWRHTF